MNAAVHLLRNSALTVGLSFVATVLVWGVILLVSGSEEFAGLISGLGSVPMVWALAGGTLKHWRSKREELRNQAREARRVTQLASRGAVVVAILAGATLAAAVPNTWSGWAAGLIWGCFGGVAFFVVFHKLNRELRWPETR